MESTRKRRMYQSRNREAYERKYKCCYCNKVFTQKSYQTRHELNICHLNPLWKNRLNAISTFVMYVVQILLISVISEVTRLWEIT